MFIEGKQIASQIRNQLCQEVKQLKNKPCLAVCMVGDNPASKIYVSRKQKACDECGIRSICEILPTESTQGDVLSLIHKWNQDKNISGVLVQLPLPSHLNRSEIVNAVSAKKDVDGFNAYNLGMLMQSSEPYFYPCTPSGICLLLDHLKIDVAGKKVCIINDSIVIGRPLAMMLLDRRATVSICHEATRRHEDRRLDDFKLYTMAADILITAVGKRPKFCLTPDLVKAGTVVIDVGISRLEDGTIKGDCEKEVEKIASMVTSVPGGIGPLTISSLLKNVIYAAKELSCEK